MFQTLPGMQIALADRGRKAIGLMGELIAKRLFESACYSVVTPQPKQHRGDLVVTDTFTGEMLKIEVKTARRGKDGKWRFTLWKKNHTDHRDADYVVLLPVLKSGRVVPFVIPVSELENQKQAVITSHPENYAGRLSVYRRSVSEFGL